MELLALLTPNASVSFEFSIIPRFWPASISNLTLTFSNLIFEDAFQYTLGRLIALRPRGFLHLGSYLPFAFAFE
jgi:hypothetical protein